MGHHSFGIPTCACSCRLNCQAEGDRLAPSLIHSWAQTLVPGAADPSAQPDAGAAGKIAAPCCPVSKRKINLQPVLGIRIRILPFSHRCVERTEIMPAKQNFNTKF
jgi:hypothetical protein